MADALGIELHPDVLPFSNIPAWLPPFLLARTGHDDGVVTEQLLYTDCLWTNFVDDRLRQSGSAGTVGTQRGAPLTVAPNDFTHLHVHSEFSLLDGLGRITELVAEAKNQGFDSLAITDHGALYGAVAFYQACKTAGIKPIIGVETYVARRSMADREGKADAQPYHLILLAKDWTGYQNLCRHRHRRPPRRLLLQAAHRSRIPGQALGGTGRAVRLPERRGRAAIETDDLDEARRIAGSYQDILGAGNFFFELQDHGPDAAVARLRRRRRRPGCRPGHRGHHAGKDCRCTPHRRDGHILIVGGGGTGGALAHDLSLRGLRVTLVERGELTSGTTGRHHGMLHSGGALRGQRPRVGGGVHRGEHDPPADLPRDLRVERRPVRRRLTTRTWSTSSRSLEGCEAAGSPHGG